MATEQHKLNVTECNPIHSGETNGKAWTLYGVKATTEDGGEFPHELKCFSALPEGPGVYELEARENEKYGLSYTIKVQGGGNGGNASNSRLEALEKRVADLEAKAGEVPEAPPPF